jgi:hypothetical protein
LAAALIAVVLVAANLAIIAATAGIAPPRPTRCRRIPSPETVSPPLPTVQINGVVWDQVIVATVFVTGQFPRRDRRVRRRASTRHHARTSWRTTSPRET